MRALFFLLDAPDNASSRHRVLQYLPYLAAHGVECTIHTPAPAWVSTPLLGAESTPAKTAFYALFFALRLRAILGARHYDAVGIQRDLFPYGPPLLERLLHRMNSRLLYDTDDATHIRPPFTPNTVFQRLRRFNKVAEVLSLCRQVTVATPALAEYARRFNPHVTVIPMAIHWQVYSEVVERRNAKVRGEGVTVGWTGTAGGFIYLRDIAPALARVAERVPVCFRFMSGSWRQLRLDGVQYDAVPWSRATELETLAAFDVGLVPLADTPFERAKFPFKLLQYMALGVPPVCARLGMAQELIVDGVNGFLASSAEEWEDRLALLAQDADLRHRVGAAARETVMDRFTVERNAPLLLEALSRTANP